MRPSQLLDIGDPYWAYCIDEAVYTFGSEVEAALQEATDEAKNKKAAIAKREMALNRYLGLQQKYRDPGAS